MERINSITAHTIKEWEDAIATRDEIELERMQLHRGNVSGAYGNISANNKKYQVKWLHDGRCYYFGKRARQYDIIFK